MCTDDEPALPTQGPRSPRRKDKVEVLENLGQVGVATATLSVQLGATTPP
jgi:hypothetical protein